MTCPSISINCAHILNHAGPKWIEVDVACKLQKIRLLLTNYRFVSVLKYLPMALVPQVEVYDISCKEAAHVLGEGLVYRSYQ